MSMVTSHLIWLLRTREIRQRAKEAGQTFDEYEEGARWQSHGIDLEKKFRGMFSQAATPASTPGLERASVDTYGTFVSPEHVTPKTVPNATV